MKKTLSTLAFLMVANTGAIAHAELEIVYGTIRRNLTSDSFCPLRVTDADGEYCALIRASTDVVDQILQRAGGSMLRLHGDWTPVPGRNKVFEIDTVYLMMNSSNETRAGNLAEKLIYGN